jgi:anti-anti-sigma factor
VPLIGTCRLYRPDPTSIGVGEQWGRASVDAAPTKDSLVVRLHGQIDASNAGHVAGYVERHAAVANALVVDTSAVDFFGTPALAALRKVDLCCAASGVDWRLVVGPAVRRALRVCGSDDLPLADSVATALRHLHVGEGSGAGPRRAGPQPV